jgi:hypothetical protein
VKIGVVIDESSKINVIEETISKLEMKIEKTDDNVRVSKYKKMLLAAKDRLKPQITILDYCTKNNVAIIYAKF